MCVESVRQDADRVRQTTEEISCVYVKPARLERCTSVCLPNPHLGRAGEPDKTFSQYLLRISLWQLLACQEAFSSLKLEAGERAVRDLKDVRRMSAQVRPSCSSLVVHSKESSVGLS